MGLWQCFCRDLFLGLETKTETLDFRSRDRDLNKMNSCALESRDHGLEITTLGYGQIAPPPTSASGV